MEDFERAALLEAVHQWFTERFGLNRFPFGSSQVYFYDRRLDEELEGDDGLYELDSIMWHELHMGINLLWSLAWGMGLAAVLIALLGFWSWSVLFWLGLGIGILAVFPCIMMQASRAAVVIEDEEDAEGETVRQVALAYLGRGFGRWLVHLLADAVLLLQWASYTRGVARLVVEDYKAKEDGPAGREHLSTRERRGAALVEKIVASMDGDGLRRLLRNF